MPPEAAAAEAVGEGEVAAKKAEVVDAGVVDEPAVEHAVGRRAEVGAVVEQGGAGGRSAKAEVVDIEVPVDAVGSPLPAEDLKGIPAGEDLRAVDLVVFDLRVVDVEGWLLGVGGEHRPPQHRHSQQPHRVAAAGDELLMLHGRLASAGIDQGLAEGTGQGHLLVGEGHLASAKLPGGHAQPAGRQPGVLGDEIAAVDLPQDIGPQLHQPRVVADRCEHGCAGDHARAARHVVVHAHRLDHTLGLAEDHVALHVEFHGDVGRLAAAAVERWLLIGLRPDHQPVGRDIERAGWVDAVDHEVDP